MQKLIWILIGAVLMNVLSACVTTQDGYETGTISDSTEITTEAVTADMHETTSDGGASTTAPPPEYPAIGVSSVRVSDSGKPYIDVSGNPFVIVGAQIRTDLLKNVDGLKLKDMEPYFKAAAELGLNCVQVPVQWSDVERDEGEYRSTSIDKYLEYCHKYGLKMEVLWFGSVMCGQSHSNHLPEYILAEGKRFPKIEYCGSNYMYGQLWLLDVGNEELIQRETAAIDRMMDYIRAWEEENGNPRIVIGVQVENEADSYVRWNNGKWDALYLLLDRVGMAVKNSSYSVYTRVNLTCVTDSQQSFVKKINSLEGIDVVGTDPYVFTPREVKNTINSFLKLENNYPLIAENSGSVPNNDVLMLASVASGGSYCIYELATMKSAGHFTCDLGVLDRNLTDRGEDTVSFRALAKGLSMVTPIAALASPSNFAAFNTRRVVRQTELVQTVVAGNISMTYQTDNGGIGFGIVENGYATVFSTKTASIDFDNCQILQVEVGRYTADGTWIKESDESMDQNTLHLVGGTVYRVSVIPGDTVLESTAASEIGCDAGEEMLGELHHSGSEATYSDGVWTTFSMDSASKLVSDKKFKNFTMSVDVQIGFIGIPGYGICFGEDGYVAIGQSWSTAYTKLFVNGTNYSNDAEITGYSFQTYKVIATQSGGRLTIKLVNPNATEKVLYDIENEATEGYVGLYSAGGFCMYSNLIIEELP